MLFNLFKKKSTPTGPAIDLSVLHTDMHSHLVPGVDDGSDTVETSLELLRGLIDLGYKKVITTPHIRPDYFPNTKEVLHAGFERLKKAVDKAGLVVELEYAAEYFVDFDFGKTLENTELLKFSGNHILVEVSTFSPPPNLFDIIFQLRIKGYQPILAHPERYVYYSDMTNFGKLKDFGCLFQLNILSLSGHYGKNVKELALKLLKAGFIDLLGTDMHHVRHLESLQKSASDGTLAKLLQQYKFQNATL